MEKYMAVNLDSLSKKIVKSILIIGSCITVGLVIYGVFCIYERERVKSQSTVSVKTKPDRWEQAAQDFTGTVNRNIELILNKGD